MSQYVNKVTLEVDGVQFTDFSGFTDNSVEKHVQVPLMNQTGHAKKTARYSFSVTTAIPFAEVAIDLDEVANGTCTVVYDNGDRVTYLGVYTLETGD
ncbi:MAG TPA: hypothetical protein ENK70_09285, partial [Methylophaga sp.]|nr:hypothetical protein [Methylophaga sp.]